MQDIQHILCNKCKKLKPNDSFKKDNIQYKTCLECRQKYAALRRDFYRKNISNIKQYKKFDRQNNKNYYILQDAASHAKQRAELKGMDCNINIAYLREIDSNICPYFNSPFIFNDPKNMFEKTLDRIDPSIGYIKGNLEFVSRKANNIKSNSTIEEQEILISWMSNFNNYHPQNITPYKFFDMKKLKSYYVRKKYKSLKEGISFTISFDYFLSILPENGKCPVFGYDLIFGLSYSDNGFSLDKFIPSLGYIEGNVSIISFKANTFKNYATLEDLLVIVNRRKNLEETKRLYGRYII